MLVVLNQRRKGCCFSVVFLGQRTEFISRGFRLWVLKVVEVKAILSEYFAIKRGADHSDLRLVGLVRPAAHVCLCGESPLTARLGEGLATQQS